MASEAQVLANRRNAEKSTGPRTEEGKAAASQNAVKHRLSARQDVISSEDHAEFDLHRERMLDELGAVGLMETTLAEGIVSLSRRLKRAERIQNEAFDYLIAKGSRRPSWDRPTWANDPNYDEKLVLGNVVAGDFGHSKVLDRLSMYERRIESSLYRTMAELRKLKVLHQQSQAEEPATKPRSPDSAVLRTSHSTLDTHIEAPYGVTTNGIESCKTKPISMAMNEGEIPGEEGGMEGVTRNEDGKTKPNPAGTIDFLPEAERATMIVGSVPVRA
jgi:hypothetical protein